MSQKPPIILVRQIKTLMDSINFCVLRNYLIVIIIQSKNSLVIKGYYNYGEVI